MPRKIIIALLLLFACQLSGECITRSINLPLPGPVVGMLLLLTILIVNRGLPTGLEPVTVPLLNHMSLLFIPAGTGIIMYADLITAEWIAIVGAIVVSTLAALLTTAATFSVLQPMTPEIASTTDQTEAAVKGDTRD